MSIAQHNLSGYGLPVIEWDRVRKTQATDDTQAPGTGGPNRHTSWLYRIEPKDPYAFGTDETVGATRYDMGDADE